MDRSFYAPASRSDLHLLKAARQGHNRPLIDGSMEIQSTQSI